MELCHEAWWGRMEQLVNWQRPVAVWRLTHQHLTNDERTELLDLLESPHASWFGQQ